MEFIEVATQEEQLSRLSHARGDGASKTGESSSSPQHSFQEANCKSLDKDEFSPTENSKHQAMKLEQYNQTGVKLKFIKDICPTPTCLEYTRATTAQLASNEQPVSMQQPLGQSQTAKAEPCEITKSAHPAMLPSGSLFSPAHNTSLVKGSILDKSAAQISSSPATGNGLFHIQLFLTSQYLDESPYSSTDKNLEKALLLKDRPQ